MLNIISPATSADSLVPASFAPVLLRAECGFRQVPLSRARHHGGRVSLGTHHPMVRVESHEEAQVARVFAARLDFSHLRSQPVTVWFRWNNQTHRYTPDFEVWLHENLAAATPPHGCHFYVEVKPSGWPMRDTSLWSARASALRAAFGLSLLILSAASAKELS